MQLHSRGAVNERLGKREARASHGISKDRNMKVKYIENGLALVGALIMLIGVSFAVSSAFAAAPLDIEHPAPITVSSGGA